MQIIAHLFEIITLRRKVGDLEYNPSVALISGSVLIALGAYINSIGTELNQPFALSFTQYTVQALLLYVLLSWQSKGSRFVQTVSAIFGTTVLLQLASLLAMNVPGLALIGLGLTLWNIYITIVIVRDSLETSTLMGLLWTIALNAVGLLIIMTLFPDFSDMLQNTMEQMENAPTPE